MHLHLQKLVGRADGVEDESQTRDEISADNCTLRGLERRQFGLAASLHVPMVNMVAHVVGNLAGCNARMSGERCSTRLALGSAPRAKGRPFAPHGTLVAQ